MGYRRPSTYSYPPKFTKLEDAENWSKRLYAELLENDSRGEEITARATDKDLKALIVRPEWYGAKGDGTTDDTAAIQAAIDKAWDDQMPVVLSAKKYRCSNLTLDSDKDGTLTILGQAPTSRYALDVAPQLYFYENDGTDFITLTNPANAGLWVQIFFVFENLNIVGPDSAMSDDWTTLTTTSGHGINFEATNVTKTCYFRNVNISGFNGADKAGLVLYDGEYSHLDNVDFSRCHWGARFLYVCNACTFTNVRAQRCHDGIYLERCIGHTWITPTIQSNREDGILTAGLRSCTFHAPYFENNNIAGTAGKYALNLRTTTGWNVENCNFNNIQLSDAADKIFLGGSSDLVFNNRFDGIYGVGSVLTQGDIDAIHGGGSGYTPDSYAKYVIIEDTQCFGISFTHMAFTAISNPAGAAILCHNADASTGLFDFPKFLGGKRWTYGTAAPTTGTWGAGDVCWNTAPSATNALGWCCITAGTSSAATDSTGDTDGSTAVITGMTETSDFTVGDYVNVSAGFASTGPFRVISKTASAMTLSAASNSAQSNVTVDTADPVWKTFAGPKFTDLTADTVTAENTIAYGLATHDDVIISPTYSGGTNTNPTSVGSVLWDSGGTDVARVQAVVDNPSTSSLSRLQFWVLAHEGTDAVLQGYVTGDGKFNINSAYQVAGTQVVGAQGAVVADATDAASVILRLNELLAILRTHGLIDTA